MAKVAEPELSRARALGTSPLDCGYQTLGDRSLKEVPAAPEHQFCVVGARYI